MQQILITRRKMRELQKKLNRLKNEDFPKNKQIMKEAMEGGSGMHDNAAYEHALQDERLLLRRIVELEEILSKAQLITPLAETDVVRVSCKIKTKNLKSGEISEMVVCGYGDTDLDKKWYSYQAPIVTVFLGKRVGDQVKFTLPASGEEQLFKIIEIHPVDLEQKEEFQNGP